MADPDPSPRPAKRRKTNALNGDLNSPLHSRALRPVKQAVYGKPSVPTADEFMIDGRAVYVTPRKTAKQHPLAELLGDENLPTPSKRKRKRFKGYAYDDDDEMDEPSRSKVNNQEQFEEITQAAAEDAAKADVEFSGQSKKSLRGRTRPGSSARKFHAKEVPDDGSKSKKRGSGRKAGRPKKANTVVAAEAEEGSESEGHDVVTGSAAGDDLNEDVWSVPEVEDQASGTIETAFTKKPARRRSANTPCETSPFVVAPAPAAELRRPNEEEPAESGESNAEELKKLFDANPGSFTLLKTHILEGLTAKRRLPLVNLDAEYQKVFQLVEQTVLAGEGNSMLVIGSRGSGKTTLVETVISEMAAANRDDFHVVRLNGFVHTDDKLALREIWRQLGVAMDVDDEMAGGRSNHADTLASLLALLSHQEEETEGAHTAVAKSVILVLDEFDLFTSHSRQTLLYNLFDAAQSRSAPLAVLGLTTKINVVDSLEKRVKSRFGQRYVHLSRPKSFPAFKQICMSALTHRPPKPPLSDRRQDKDSNAATAATIPETVSAAWNRYTRTQLFTSPPLLSHLHKLYRTTKTPSAFLTSSLLPLARLTPSAVGGLETAFATPLQSGGSSSLLQPPDSKLGLLPGLSALCLSLLIAAARLDVILSTDLATFQTVYGEYVALASRTKLQTSAAGQVAVGGAAGGARVWGVGVARGAWEELVGLGLVLSATSASSAGGARGATGKGEMWRVDVGLEEIGAWIEGEGGRGAGGGLGKWCREI